MPVGTVSGDTASHLLIGSVAATTQALEINRTSPAVDNFTGWLQRLKIKIPLTVKFMEVMFDIQFRYLIQMYFQVDGVSPC